MSRELASFFESGRRGRMPIVHPRHTGDGTTKAFSAPAHAKILPPEAYIVTIDGARQRPGYSYYTDSLNEIKFYDAPPTGTDIDILLTNIQEAVPYGDATSLSIVPKGMPEGARTSLIDAFQSPTFINVKDYGAKGDSATNDSVAIQQAIDASWKSYSAGGKGGYIYLPPGIYMIDKPLLIHDGQTIIGAGSLNTNLKRTNSDKSGYKDVSAPNSTAVDEMDVDAFFILVHESEQYSTNIRIEGLRLLGSKAGLNASSSGATKYGIYAPRLQLGIFRDILFHRCEYAFFTHDAWMVEATDLVAQYCGSLFKYKHDGVSTIGCGTSLMANRCWASSALVSDVSFYYPAYDFEKLTYSSLICCGADNWYSPYSFRESDITLTACGNEIARSTSAIICRDSNVVINNHRFVSPAHQGNTTAQLWIQGSSEVIVNGAKFSNQTNAGSGQHDILVKDTASLVATNVVYSNAETPFTISNTATAIITSKGVTSHYIVDQTTGDRVVTSTNRLRIESRSTQQFGNAGHSINTVDKYEGKQAWSTTLNRPVWASGAAATDPWLYADGTEYIVPSI